MAVTDLLTAATARDVLSRCAVVASAAGLVLLAAVPDLNRFVVVLGAFTLVAAVAAAVLQWRLLGTATLTAGVLTALLAGTLDVSALRPVQAVAEAGLLAALVAALGACEDGGVRSPYATVVAVRPRGARALPLVLALLAGALVAVAAAQDVGASFPLVVAGLAAAVVALVVAASAHRS